MANEKAIRLKIALAKVSKGWVMLTHVFRVFERLVCRPVHAESICPVHRCIYQHFSLIQTARKCQAILITSLRLFALNVFRLPAEDLHNLFNYGWQLMRCICAINYVSAESPKNCFACSIMLRATAIRFRFSKRFHDRKTIVNSPRQLQIEFKRLRRLFYGNCAPNDINFSLLHRFNISTHIKPWLVRQVPINLN